MKVKFLQKRMKKMNNNTFNVGLVIADINEYRNLDKYFDGKAERCDIASLLGHKLIIEGATQNICLRTVCCGIGKVNAASGAALLAKDCDLVINAGLSGGFGGAKKYDIVIGTELIEHDFDLTPIGYELTVKPGDEGRLSCDEDFNKDILSKFKFVKDGVFVTGDKFVCTEELHNMLSDMFNPIACDMESAAVAHSCKLFNVPFVSIRMVSDGADDDSAETYTDTLNCDKADGWTSVVFNWLKTL